MISEIMNRHCMTNHLKVESDESKDLLCLTRMPPTLRHTQVDFPFFSLAKRPVGNRFPFALGAMQMDNLSIEGFAV